MQSTIQLLSDETINQIAAGEVIESPASVVKEIVENALDASANKITVEIVGGGMKTIRIIDDGIGMNPLDAKMSIVRHATSKISKAQDLFHISTKGFRGEALASIASISEMTIETAKENETGTKLEICRGEIVKETKCARRRGTTFEVRSLFHNVPARKKFQKGIPALSAEIYRLMTFMALSHPDVQFELVSSGKKTLITYPNEGLEKRGQTLLGKDFSHPVKFEEESFRIEGWIAGPNQSRPNKMGQYLFINKRFVQCNEISDAVRKGYGTRLDEKRYPQFFLHLEVSPDLIDVNVHPQKLHVRLRKEELFREKVSVAIERSFGSKQIFSNPFIQPIDTEYEEPSFRFQEEVAEEEPLLAIEGEPVEILTQWKGWLIVKHQDEISLINLEAASFRIHYERLIRASDTRVEKQGLLIPFSIDLTPVESAMVLTHQVAIEEIGFTLKAIGKDVFMVEALPPFLEEKEVKTVICEMADILQTFIGKADYEEARKKKLALSCAQYARPKKYYSQEEGRRLFEALLCCENQTYCPKGTPIRVILDDEAIEKLFREDQKTSKRNC